MILAVNVNSINCLSIAYMSIEFYYTVIHFSELHPINIRFWNVESLSWHICGWNTLPAILESLPTATDDVHSCHQCLYLYFRHSLIAQSTDDAETVRYSNASLFYLRKTLCLLPSIEEVHFYGVLWVDYSGHGAMTQCCFFAW